MPKIKIANDLKSQYDLSDRQAYKIIRDALKDLQEASSDFSIDDIKTEYISRIESVLEKAIEEKNYNVFLKCQEMLNKLYQLYVEKQEVTVTNDVIKFKFDS